jgi:Undecaprenyl-phosphate galactose phosphotransferase WbaP
VEAGEGTIVERLESPGITAGESSLEDLDAELRLAPAEAVVVAPWVRIFRVSLLAVTDVVVLVGIGALCVWLWAINVRGQTFSHYLGFFPFVTLFLLGFAKAGLYPGFGIGAVETLRRFSLWTSFTFLALAGASFAFKTPQVYSRATFFLAWAACLLALPVVRFFLLSVVTRASWWGEPVVVIGTGSVARRAIRALRSALSLGYCPRCILSVRGKKLKRFEGLPIVGGLEQAAALSEQGVRVALLATEGMEGDSALIEPLQAYFRRVIVIRERGRTPIEGVEVRNLGGVLGIEFRNELLRKRNRLVKRSLDIVIGTVALIVAAPLIGMSALLIRVATRGPAFFSQVREGLDGRKIRVWKLRSMYRDSGRRLEEHFKVRPDARAEWEARFKLKDDPRVIPVLGTLLRRFSLDELPQLWSVVVGEMSLVGPRPFPEYHLRKFGPEFRTLRRKVRPGITGLWQVMVRSSGGLNEQETYDSYYIRNWSVWMDLYILGRTTLAVLAGRGAY